MIINWLIYHILSIFSFIATKNGKDHYVGWSFFTLQGCLGQKKISCLKGLILLIPLSGPLVFFKMQSMKIELCAHANSFVRPGKWELKTKKKFRAEIFHHFWPKNLVSENNVFSLLFPKESFCNRSIELWTFVNGSNRTLKSGVELHL